MKKEHFFGFLKYSRTPNLLRDLRGRHKYHVDIGSGKGYFEGRKGLKILSRKLAKDIRFRYHVTESIPPKNPIGIDDNRIPYSSFVNRWSPWNEVNISMFFSFVPAGRPSAFWGKEPSLDQLSRSKILARSWFNKAKESLSFRERVELNNEMLGKLSEITTSHQGFGIFRGFFKSHGIVNFFFLPGVAKDFALTKRQLNQLEAASEQEIQTVRDRIDELVDLELKTIRSVLSPSEIALLEKHIGLALEDILVDRASFFFEVGGFPWSEEDFDYQVKFPRRIIR